MNIILTVPSQSAPQPLKCVGVPISLDRVDPTLIKRRILLIRCHSIRAKAAFTPRPHQCLPLEQPPMPPNSQSL